MPQGARPCVAGRRGPGRPLASLFLRWVFLAALCQGANAAEPPAAGSSLGRLIGADGLGLGTVKRSDLDALWGRAEVEKPVTPSLQSRERGLGPWLRLEYPSRGLSFSTPGGTYGMADPPVAYASFTHPFKGCTPQGLCMGMPQAEALAIISAHYRVTGEHAVSWGNSGRVSGRSYSVRNLGWRKTHTASFGFNEGRLYAMRFQLIPTPFMSMAQLRAGFGALLGFAVLVLIGLGIEVVKRRLKPVSETPLWEFGRLGVGSGLLIVGVGGMFLGFSAMSGGGDGYARMASLILGLGACGLVVLALVVFSRSSNRFISGGASAVLLLGIIGLLAAKLF